MSSKKKILIALAAAAALIAIIVVVRIVARNAAAGRRQNAPVVRVEQPTRDTVASVLEYTGDVVAIQQATIVAKVSGTLEQVNVSLGAWARQGDVLAVIDSTEVFQQAQQSAASYYTARSDFERTKQLFANNLASQQIYDNAEALLKVAQANYELAKARLGYARVTAPFSGYVTRRFLDPGAQATANATSLFTLMDLSTVKLSVDIMEKDVPLVTVGKKAVIEADALPGRKFLGTVSRLGQAIDPSTRTMETEIVVPNDDRLLKPGMYATVTIVLGQRTNAITVPADAVLSDNSGPYVFVLDGKNARRVPVKTGDDRDGRTEITSGLNGSEQVIVTGQQYAKDGGPVTLPQAQDAGGKGAGSGKRPAGNKP